jgi:hypothetical protein
MSYGLELTWRLLREIEALVTLHGSQFMIFRTEPVAPLELHDGAWREVVHVLNGKYYRTSGEQFRANVEYMTRGLVSFVVPVTLEDAGVGPEDGHLNEHAVDEVMHELASMIQGRIPASAVGARQ